MARSHTFYSFYLNFLPAGENKFVGAALRVFTNKSKIFTLIFDMLHAFIFVSTPLFTPAIATANLLVKYLKENLLQIFKIVLKTRFSTLISTFQVFVNNIMPRSQDL